MAYKKRHPLRISLSRDSYDILAETLLMNEAEFFDFGGMSFISEEARCLIDKMEAHGRSEIDSQGNEIMRLGFFEREGEQLIYQFVASAIVFSHLRELYEKQEEGDGK